MAHLNTAFPTLLAPEDNYKNLRSLNEDEMKSPVGKDAWRKFVMAVSPTRPSPPRCFRPALLCMPDLAIIVAIMTVREDRAGLQLWNAHPDRLLERLRPGQHHPRYVQPLTSMSRHFE